MPLQAEVQSRGRAMSVSCHLEVRRDSFIWGTPNSSCLIIPTTLRCDPQLLLLLSWHHSFSLLLHWVRGPARSTCPPCPGPHPMSIHGGLAQGCILPLWVQHRNPQGISSAVEYLRQYGSGPCQSCVGRNVTCSGEISFISFFVSSVLPGLDQGLGESGQWQAKSWPDPCLFCPGFMGLHRRMHRPVCLQDTVIFSTQHRWHPLQYYQLTLITTVSPNVTWLIF